MLMVWSKNDVGGAVVCVLPAGLAVVPVPVNVPAFVLDTGAGVVGGANAFDTGTDLTCDVCGVTRSKAFDG